MENRISVTISQEAVSAINAAIATIEQNLPNLVNLTKDERHSLPKMGDKSLAFVTKALEFAKQNPSIVPTFLDVPEFEKDVNAATSLNKILVPLQQLTEKLDDTTLLAGSEAYAAALIFYYAAKGASKGGVPGIKTINDEMQARFPGRGKSNGKSEAKDKVE